MLGDDIAAHLPLMRAQAESRMSDSCKVFRLIKSSVIDEDTGTYPTVEQVAYSGQCRVKHPSTAAKDANSGSQLVVISQSEIHLPLSAVGVLPADLVEITACPTRPDQVGRLFTIAAPFDGSQTTALRYRVEVADAR